MLARAGLQWEVVPGVSSAFAVPAVAGIPVTHRGLSSSVTVVTGRVDDPIGGVDWEALAKIDGTLVILMGMMDRAEIADALQRGGQAGVDTVGRDRTRHDSGSGGGPDHPRPYGRGRVGITCGDCGGPGGRPRRGRIAAECVHAPGPSARSHDYRHPIGPRGGSDWLRHCMRLAPRRSALHSPSRSALTIGGAALRSAANDAGDFRWIIFTSVNAVTRFMEEVRDARAFGTTLVAAVGPATADALRGAGWNPT